MFRNGQRSRSKFLLLSVGIAVLVTLGSITVGRTTVPISNLAQATSPELSKRASLGESYGRLPLSFEVNEGQTDQEVKFLSRGQSYSLFLTYDEVVLSLRTADEKEKGTDQKPAAQDVFVDSTGATFSRSFHLTPTRFENRSAMHERIRSSNTQRSAPGVLRMKLVGANPSPKVAGQDKLPGKSNYFIANDPQKWQTNIPTYAKVKYADVYPGVDLIYYGNQGQLEYDFVVAPGTDPAVIRLRMSGDGVGFRGRREHQEGGHLHIDANGDLVIETRGGEVRFHKPVVYQSVRETYRSSGHLQVMAGKPPQLTNRKYVEGNYVLTAEDQVSFKVAAYDVSQPLVIDPVLAYSTYLGGSHDDQGLAIATDFHGNAYVTGETCSANFPTVNAARPTYRGGCDVFVTKLNSTGSAVVYSTYLGGSAEEAGYGIAVDLAGNAYVTGSTYSPDFPTKNAIQPHPGNDGGTPGELGALFDAFVTKLNGTGSRLVYSTYLGGSEFDVGLGIAVDPFANAYVTGVTESEDDFPTANAIQPTAGGRADAFVTKLNSAGSRMVYSTYLGGSDFDQGMGIATDLVGNAYVTGETHSTNFPVANAIQPTLGGGPFDAFVTKLNRSGSALTYSTFLGGDGWDQGFGIATDLLGNAYVTGDTCSANFPIVNAIQPIYHGGCDALVTKLNASGWKLLYSTYLGGSDFDAGSGIAVDLFGNAYIAGSTRSTNFPTANAIQRNHGGGVVDAFVTKLNRSGSRLAYSTYLGGSNIDQGNAIAALRPGSAYVTGVTLSPDFPVAHPLPAPHDALQGATDSYVTKIRTDTLPP